MIGAVAFYGVLWLLGLVLVSAFAAWRSYRAEARRVVEGLVGLVEATAVEELHERLQPELQEKVEAPLLRAFMLCCADRLGKFQAVEKGSLKMRETSGANPLTIVTATLKFQKDKVACEVYVSGGLYAGFNFRPVTGSLPLAEYAAVPEFEGVAEEWLGLLLQKKATAVLELMHAALLKDWSAEKLLEAVDKALRVIGGLRDGEYDAAVQSNRRVDQPPGLEFIFLVLGNEADVEGKVRLIFDGFQSRVIAFHLAIVNMKEIAIVER
eukprot:EG_transcript_20544